MELDPVQLLRDIRALQDALWSYAYVEPITSLPSSDNGANSPTEPDIILEEQREQSVSQIKTTVANHPDSSPTRCPLQDVDEAQRRYRRSKPQRRPYQGPRWWRTRPDPFVEVWPEVERQLAQTPDLSAKALFERVQQTYPGQFNEGQLRTFQRRVRDWRMRYSASPDEQKEPLAQTVPDS
jgi:hypothetical protein